MKINDTFTVDSDDESIVYIYINGRGAVRINNTITGVHIQASTDDGIDIDDIFIENAEYLPE